MSSTVGYLGKQTNWDPDVYGQQTQTNREAQWGSIPAEIVSYDAATQTATVKPLYKPVQNGEPVEMAELYEVPVEFPRSANSAITHPIPAGTKVMLNPSMRSREKYDDENDGAPSDARSFHLSDMRATITGGDSLTDPLPNVDPNNTHMRFDAQGQYGIKGSPDGKVRIDGNQGNIYDLLAQAVDRTGDGFLLLGTEPALVHTAEYTQIGNDLKAIYAKLQAMAL
jgi:hypothetical protein